MESVKWVKLTTDMFDNRKIKYLRTLPEGNNIVLIWVMLLTLAGRCNAGGMIFLTENVPYTTKMLADELGFEENTVVLALQALAKLEMLTAGEFLQVEGWSTYQNADALDRIRERDRLRKKKERETKKLLPHEEIPGMSMDAPRTAPRTLSRDIEIENIEEELKKEIVKKESRFAPPTVTEVEAYIKGLGLYIDGVKFCDFYESKGWMVGKNKMKDWRAAARNWSRRDKVSAPQEQSRAVVDSEVDEMQEFLQSLRDS